MLNETFELEVKCGFTREWIKIGNNDALSDLKKRKAFIDFRRQNQAEPRWVDSRIIKVSRVVYA